MSICYGIVRWYLTIHPQTYLSEQQPTVSAWSSSFSLPALSASLSKYRTPVKLTEKRQIISLGKPNLCIYKQLSCGFRSFMFYGYKKKWQLLFYMIIRLCFAMKINIYKEIIQHYNSIQFLSN